MQASDTVISRAKGEDIGSLWDLITSLGAARDTDYFDRCFELQAQGQRDILIANISGVIAGYCILNWEPKYNLFKKLGIAEIQDLNVSRDFRQKGIGSAMIKYCEDQAKLRGLEEMGIAVGLNPSFGAAQRLYVRLGYVPDGSGVSYDRKPVKAGDITPVDDDLCLMLIKTLT